MKNRCPTKGNPISRSPVSPSGVALQGIEWHDRVSPSSGDGDRLCDGCPAPRCGADIRPDSGVDAWMRPLRSLRRRTGTLKRPGNTSPGRRESMSRKERPPFLSSRPWLPWDGTRTRARRSTALCMIERTERRSAHIGLTQPLFTWGQVSAAIRAAKVGLQSAENSSASTSRRPSEMSPPPSTTCSSPGNSMPWRPQPRTEETAPGGGETEVPGRCGHRLRCPGGRGIGGKRPSRGDPDGKSDPHRTGAAALLLAREWGDRRDRGA